MQDKRLDRRQMLKRAAVFSIATPAISVLLAACRGSDDPTPAETNPRPDDVSPPDATREGDETPVSESTPGSDTTPTQDDTPATDDGSPTTTAAPDGEGGIINIPSTLGDTAVGNPILTSAIQMIEWYVFNRLVVFDDEGTLQPELAESWEFSDDQTELTLNLAEADWHDGERFTADDVLFTFDTIRDDSTDTGKRSSLQVSGEYFRWEKVDDQTVTISTARPLAPLLFNLNEIAIIPEHLLEGVDDINTDDFNHNPVGTGSFRLAEWQANDFIRLERFEDHFRGAALAHGITIKHFPDSEAGVAALEAGEIDMVYVPAGNQAGFEDNPDFSLQTYVYFTSITLAFNHKHPILSDLTVRKAIELGIDKGSLTEAVTAGRSVPSGNQFAADGPLDRYNDYDNVPPAVFDPAEANRMLDEAGYPMGEDGLRISPDGERLSFNSVTYSGFAEYQSALVIVQEMLREIGIDIVSTVVEYATLQGMWADTEADPASRAIELDEWPHPFEFDPDLFNELHSSNMPPGSNYMWFADDDIDQLIEQGRTETDPDARVEIYKQIDVRRSEVLPAIPLYAAVDSWAVSNTVLGRDGEPITSPYFSRALLTAGHNWYKDS